MLSAWLSGAASPYLPAIHSEIKARDTAASLCDLIGQLVLRAAVDVSNGGIQHALLEIIDAPVLIWLDIHLGPQVIQLNMAFDDAISHQPLVLEHQLQQAHPVG